MSSNSVKKHNRALNNEEDITVPGLLDIGNFETVNALLDALPSVVLLLNLNRKIVYCNKNYFKELGSISARKALGIGPGELLGCINAKEGVNCGTSDNCKVCGLVNTVIDSQNERSDIVRNTEITVMNEAGKFINIDFRVTASPFNMADNKFTLVTINDVSKESRIKSLERIFLHDLYDKVSSLKFLLETIIDKGIQAKSNEKLNHSKFLSAEIVEDIDAYRAILEAEKGDLKISSELVNSYDVVWNAVNNISYHTVAHGKSIEVLEDSDRINFSTDPNVLSRILMNMLKNALEETSMGGTVTISCRRGKNRLTFSVHNKTVMSKEAKTHVFERQFSTKGINRGLGTYSMRLLGVEYLGGEVYFHSNKKQGTTFFFTQSLNSNKT